MLASTTRGTRLDSGRPPWKAVSIASVIASVGYLSPCPSRRGDGVMGRYFTEALYISVALPKRVRPPGRSIGPLYSNAQREKFDTGARRL